MKDKIESLAQTARDLAGKAQEKVGDGTESLRSAFDQVGNLGQLGSGVAQGLTTDVNELLPAIARAGYRVQGIDVDLALPPKLAVHCHLDTLVGPEDRQALLDSLDGHRIAGAAVRALFQVTDLHKNLVVGPLKPSDVILELGASPAVKVRYREREFGAES
jgi:hypothetical protein